MKLLLATWNNSKISWLTNGFSRLNLPIHSIDKNEISDVEETGKTCTENALIKIHAIGKRNNNIIIGEDSILSIDALDGFPGVKTARWMTGSDDDRSLKLLDMMKNIPIENRSAKFVSAIALLFPDGKEEIYQGVLTGSISDKLLNFPGKGYKQIFLLENGNPLSESNGNLIQPNDHRDQAINSAIVGIQKWINSNVV